MNFFLPISRDPFPRSSYAFNPHSLCSSTPDTIPSPAVLHRASSFVFLIAGDVPLQRRKVLPPRPPLQSPPPSQPLLTFKYSLKIQRFSNSPKPVVTCTLMGVKANATWPRGRTPEASDQGPNLVFIYFPMYPYFMIRKKFLIFESPSGNQYLII